MAVPEHYEPRNIIDDLIDGTSEQRLLDDLKIIRERKRKAMLRRDSEDRRVLKFMALEKVIINLLVVARDRDRQERNA